MRDVVRSLMMILVLSTPGRAGESQNGHWRVLTEGNTLRQLHCDPRGQGRFSPPLLAGPGVVCERGGALDVVLQGPELRLRWATQGPGQAVSWSVPFRRDGFYDADAHRLYGSADSTESQPYRESYRKFVGSTGHARYVEEFKRVDADRPSSFGGGTSAGTLWLGPAGRMLLCGDRELGFDLDVHWPGSERLACGVAADRLTFQGLLTGALVMRIEPGGTIRIPGSGFEPLRLAFHPDRPLTQSLTGKRVSLNHLVDEFLEQGLFFYPGVLTGGDWLHGAVTTHQLDEPRSPYGQQVRRGILETANVGYDRCGHFGLLYCWGNSPNYGDGGFLAPSVDARHLHVNWVFITAVARYGLMTRDRALLHSRRGRWVALDEDPPICGSRASVADPILVKGDWRIDGRLPTRHTLGQSFRARKPFHSVRIAVTNPADSPARAVVMLRREGPAGEVLKEASSMVAPHASRQELRVVLSDPLPAGTYLVELADAESGRKWDGGLGWWTDPDGGNSDGEAFNGPFHGDLWDLLKTLFDYSYEWFGPRRHGVASYDPESGCGINRSGRPGDPMVCVSYWEQYGGGKDLWSSLWYPSACSAMAELARWLGLDAEAVRYEALRREADVAFRRTFGRDVVDNGEAHYRYVACLDWDGGVHDYGHTHYNLEGIARGIADPEAARRILHWIDHGAYSPDGGTTWRRGIHQFWQIVPPFLTINARDWQGLGGMTGGFLFGEVLAAGGARLGTVYPELIARVRTLGADDGWERTLQVLDRYARPDRLTGGRIHADPGGRGRWHFGPPKLDRADIEGFREIFPDNGAAATALPVAFFGLEPTAAGLEIRPRIPSALEGMDLGGLGYAGAVWRLSVRSSRHPGECSLTVTRTDGALTGWSLKIGGRTSCPGPIPGVPGLMLHADLGAGEAAILQPPAPAPSSGRSSRGQAN